jgi:hypothetical protein
VLYPTPRLPLHHTALAPVAPTSHAPLWVSLAFLSRAPAAGPAAAAAGGLLAGVVLTHWSCLPGPLLPPTAQGQEGADALAHPRGAPGVAAAAGGSAAGGGGSGGGAVLAAEEEEEVGA